jgi:hypothetical protein
MPCFFNMGNMNITRSKFFIITYIHIFGLMFIHIWDSGDSGIYSLKTDLENKG